MTPGIKMMSECDFWTEVVRGVNVNRLLDVSERREPAA
jgi:hypothetical protein